MSIATTTLQRTHNPTPPQSRHLHPVSPQVSAASPTLDSIAQNPKLALLLSPEDAAELVLSCAAVMAVLHQRSVAPVTRAADDRIINAEELAKILGKSKRWVEGNLEDLPPRRSLVGNPCWLLSDVEDWMRKTPRYNRAA